MSFVGFFGFFLSFTVITHVHNVEYYVEILAISLTMVQMFPFLSVPKTAKNSSRHLNFSR